MDDFEARVLPVLQYHAKRSFKDEDQRQDAVIAGWYAYATHPNPTAIDPVAFAWWAVKRIRNGREPLPGLRRKRKGGEPLDAAWRRKGGYLQGGDRLAKVLQSSLRKRMAQPQASPPAA